MTKPIDGIMGHAFKHLAVRLWTALLLGGLAALVVLRPFAEAVGPQWMIAPGLCLVALAYWGTGLLFGAMGRHRLDRLIGEATVWERAGMDREARQALARAEATVDSFYFSPLARRVPAGRLLAQMARFQLSQTSPETASEAVIDAYLQRFPRDREAAVKWLERDPSGRGATGRSHDIAAAIGAAHADDGIIQRLLAQFYLAERRCDFAALQTYRRLLEAEEPLPNDLVDGIADLFLAQQRADALALKAYLAAHDGGPTGRRRLLPGMAACCRRVHPTALTLPLLKRAEAALQEVAPSRRRDLAETFLPEGITPAPDAAPGGRESSLPAIWSTLRRTGAALVRLAGVAAAAAGRFAGSLRGGLSSRLTKTTVKWSAIGLLIAAVGWLVINTAIHLADEFKPVEKAPEPAVVPVTDPFTLQVAAYLKESDAQRFVDRLTGQGLDAYWTRATGNGKTWYQVRISHFATKAEARAVGEDLKARQLIGDYYVANYKRPDLP